VASNELGEFLRTRRQALRPADVGLAPGGRRRTPGLRREEIALLANVTVDYYERLEQSRAGHPSETLLAGIARALRLSVDERDYLYRLAGYRPPATNAVSSYVEPAMMFLLDALTTVPAHVINDLTTILAQNSLSCGSPDSGRTCRSHRCKAPARRWPIHRPGGWTYSAISC
jgi:transcriptional regulator with XRE-family HTH domain